MLSAFPFSLSIGFPACHPYGPQINKPISPISGWSPLLSELLKDFSTLDHFLWLAPNTTFSLKFHQNDFNKLLVNVTSFKIQCHLRFGIFFFIPKSQKVNRGLSVLVMGRAPVLGCLGCCHKIPLSEWLIKRMRFSQFWRLGSLWLQHWKTLF